MTDIMWGSSLIIYSIINVHTPLPILTIQLLSVNPSELLFNWNSVDSNCSSLQYSIISDCGTCSINLQTNISCNIGQPTTTEDMCSFAIQSVLCDNITGNLSAPISVTLKSSEIIIHSYNSHLFGHVRS